ncbi:phage tail sheath family protein [Pandoraea anhela]|uniref:Phage tail protein n=1 Tax=Pandoraea anhela TaxID=2508295 RepID=A0A5E4RD97_9BURK|nr:phage tail sheath C-terminal domain-containing protein [Pandoraea anhela]VVD60472.1 phage tail protein [Pandoraea anhela]
MAQYKTPGVYVVEQNAFPNSVVEVATAVPAFIGYTQFADNKGTPLAGTPWRISSMAEFIMYFGGPPPTTYSLDTIATAKATDTSADKSADKPEDKAADKPAADGAADAPKRPVVTDLFIGAVGARKPFKFTPQTKEYLLYYSMLFFFQNGGGPCYIVSVGTYADGDIDSGKLTAGIDALVKEQEPTMVLVPDAVRLSRQDCATVQTHMLQHCGYTMRNRFAILDVFDGMWDRQAPGGDAITNFRDDVGTSFLDFGAAYYPWVNTSIVTEKDLDFTKISNLAQLQALITTELAAVINPPETASPADKAKAKQVKDVVAKLTGGAPAAKTDGAATPAADGDADAAKPADAGGDAKPAAPMSKDDIATLHKTLSVISTVYVQVLQALQKKVNLMPPAAGMAGLYTLVDNTRGVWKAPANISLNGVVSPCVNISNADQEDLNVPTSGKSVNAIRSFIGEGVLVWGARTLDGNSLDWRYLSVRRTMIMIEESLRLACKAYVFEPNTANTWVTIKSMVRNFLTSVWKRGGLAGASPDDAFQVFVGLGETMTGDDILEGLLKVTVLVAVSRPAEFIELTFQQQMQKS